VHICTYCTTRYKVTAHAPPQILAEQAAAPSAESNPSAQGAVAVAAVVVAASVSAAGLFLVMEPKERPDDPTPYETIHIGDGEKPPPPEPGIHIPEVGTTAGTVPPPPEPEPDPSGTFDPHHSLLAGDHLWVTGMFTNDSPFVLSKVKINAVYVDGDGKEVGLDFGFASRDAVAPGQTIPLRLLVDTPADGITIRYEPELSKMTYDIGLVGGLVVEPFEPKRSDYGDRWEFSGKVVNNGSEPARFVQVETLIWDADDKLCGYDTAYAGGTEVLDVGKSAHWQVMSAACATKAARFEYAVTGRRPR